MLDLSNVAVIDSKVEDDEYTYYTIYADIDIIKRINMFYVKLSYINEVIIVFDEWYTISSPCLNPLDDVNDLWRIKLKKHPVQIRNEIIDELLK